MALGRAPRTRSVLLATGALVVCVSPFAVAKTGDNLKEGKRNGTTSKETEIIGNLKASTGQKGGYVTRQSNLSNSGGGAIYGCRSRAGGSSAKPPQNPCIRANNLSTGLAFEFNSSKSSVIGSISSGTGGDGIKPFVTNATGVATGLNADRVDGADLPQILAAATAITAQAAQAVSAAATEAANAAKDRWVRIRENDAGTGATIIDQSGGFTLVNCYTDNGNCYINAGSDVTNRALWSEILTENTTGGTGAANMANPGADGLTALAGSTSSAPCGLALVACAPTGTEDDNVFLVTPRDNNDEIPAANDRYSFTAFVSAATAAPAAP